MEKKEMILAMAKHYTNGNEAAFSRLLGVNPQTLASWKARGYFNAEILYQKLCGISAHWLLSNGDGHMLHEKEHAVVTNQQLEAKNHSQIITGNANNIQSFEGSHQEDVLKAQLFGLREQIGILQKENEDLRNDKKSLQRDKEILQEDKILLKYIIYGNKDIQGL